VMIDEIRSRRGAVELRSASIPAPATRQTCCLRRSEAQPADPSPFGGGNEAGRDARSGLLPPTDAVRSVVGAASAGFFARWKLLADGGR